MVKATYDRIKAFVEDYERAHEGRLPSTGEIVTGTGFCRTTVNSYLFFVLNDRRKLTEEAENAETDSGNAAPAESAKKGRGKRSKIPDKIPVHENFRKRYVAVTATFDTEGNLLPRSLFWDEKTEYPVERAKNITNQLQGLERRMYDLYEIVIMNRPRYLYFERRTSTRGVIIGRWFLKEFD